ncbi:ABC transporter permease [Sinorhizobium meliloti]|uniref:ABC transporter permease n=1 Tax=Rhizobium meliloti TaxID=382 RepID=UPI000FD44EC7|nr:ABC transporter permease [Sinorhizobium meliloti]MDX0851124.1 ABC transporter permease [Sinorhizobium medicae]MDW9394360.1 ABC transporter permease [Sinorhizobium meliloti]MDW9434553.1 ABC transporter permease [Sinorhizobium meliloti]MDW9487202.1 ABC transporter permease [Sinorhizobium meliloti]MDW9605873.1 ABC transporter permease [Sinorhizobium meliloti]
MGYFSIHVRVVGALLVREMSTRFGSKPGGYVWALLDPAAHILLMTAIFQAIARAPALGTSFALFFATGYIAFQFYQATTSYLNAAVKANKALLSYPNVAPVDTIVARLILQMGTTSLVAFIVLGSIVATMRVETQVHWPSILEATALACLFGLGVGLINCVLFLKYPLYEQVFSIVNRPLFLISGVFFLPDSIPAPYRDLVLINPLVHVIMGFRQGFYPEYRAIGLDMSYLYGIAFLTLFTGMLVFTLSRKTLRNE